MTTTQKNKTSILLLSIDVETTGLSVYNDEATQIALAIRRLVRVEEDAQADDDPPTKTSSCSSSSSWTSTTLPSFVSYIKCKRPISSKSTEITGISAVTVASAPSAATVYTQLLDHVRSVATDDDIRVLIGHNVIGYDLPLIVADVHRAFADKATSWWRSMKLTYIADSLQLARLHVDETKLLRNATGRCSYKLGDLYMAICGQKLEGAHDALADCEATLSLLDDKTMNNVLMTLCQCVDIPVGCGVTKAMTKITTFLDSFNAYNKNKVTTKVTVGRSLMPLLMNKKRKSPDNAVAVVDDAMNAVAVTNHAVEDVVTKDAVVVISQ